MKDTESTSGGGFFDCYNFFHVALKLVVQDKQIITAIGFARKFYKKSDSKFEALAANTGQLQGTERSTLKGFDVLSDQGFDQSEAKQKTPSKDVRGIRKEQKECS